MGRVHRVHSSQPARAPSAQLALPRGHRARPRLPPRSAARAPRAYSTSACRARHARLRVRPCLRACAPRRASAAHPNACCPNAQHLRPTLVSWPCVRAGMAVSWPASRHSAAQPPSPLSQYTHCIAIQNSCCQPSPIAIQCNRQ